MTKKKRLDTAQLEALYAGEITFDRWARENIHHFEALAATLINRWASPGVDVDDLVQVMLLKMWERMPLRTHYSHRSLRTWVIGEAVYYAKRTLHSARGAKSASDKAPSREPGVVRGDHFPEQVEEAVQERVCGALDAVRGAESDRERALLEALLVTQSFELAAVDESIKEMFGSTKVATRVMRKAAEDYAVVGGDAIDSMKRAIQETAA